MENIVYQIKHTAWKSILFKDQQFWVSTTPLFNLEMFEKQEDQDSTLGYDIQRISSIYFEEDTDKIKITYKDQQLNKQTTTLRFDDKTLSNEIGHYLGKKAALPVHIKKENEPKSLFFLFLYTVFIGWFTYMLYTLDDTTELISTERSIRNQNRGALLKIIVDTIGPTGVLIMGRGVTLLLLYDLCTRIVRPTREITYH